MQTGKILSSAEVKKIIAEHFGVDEDKVQQMKYSYVVIDGKEGK